MVTSSPRADTGQPVSRLVAPVLRRLSALLVLMALICVAGVALSIAGVTSLTDAAGPARSAQHRVAADMAAMQIAVAQYSATGDPTQRTTYQDALTHLKSDRERLLSAVDDDSDSYLGARAELTALDNWVDEYAAKALALPSDKMKVASPLYAVGLRTSAAFDSRREALESTLAERTDAAASSVILRYRVTIVAVLALLGLSWILVSRARAKLLHELSDPLLKLEKVVQRMLRNDPEGRADQRSGPKEVRAIARALNDFADAQSRARAVEGRIQDELHVLDSAKDDFVSNVSHELRTPLTTISGYLELVAEEFEGRLEPRHERMLEATWRNVVRLRALIDDLLALSKAENRPSELEPADVSAMVTDAVTDVRMTAARRGITLDVRAPDEPLRVVCDRAMVYRAFLNVLSNAVKFSHDDSHVEVAVRRVQSKVEVSVRDHGIGIPRAELDRLGTRFFRASNAMTNEIAGTGLGLRIVQTIIDKHAGDVVIESAEGKGTTVYVRLRLHTEAIEGPAREDEGTDWGSEATLVRDTPVG